MSSPQPIPTIPCHHCGYDLTGIAPANRKRPSWIVCPECGKQSNTNITPMPTMSWWRFPIAVIAGTLTTWLAMFLVYKFMMGLPGSGIWAKDLFSLPMFTGIALGGAASMTVVWRERIAVLRAERPPHRFPPRTLWFLCVDFVMYCIVNSMLLFLFIWFLTR